MRNLNQNLAEIEKRITDSDGCVLMFDFDGTLSPIAKTPDKAILPASTKRLLEACSARFPVAIISGRSLDVLKDKIGIDGLIYAGSHGVEWEIDGKPGRFDVPDRLLDSIQTIKLSLAKPLSKFPGMLLEDKRLSLAIHYRLVSPTLETSFKQVVMGALQPILGEDFELVEGKKVFELRPKVDWNKGYFAEFAISQLEQKTKKRLLTIYVGDDTTDEDVFERLPNAVTVRIGNKVGSAAHYYLEKQSQIDKFLEWALRSTPLKFQF